MTQDRLLSEAALLKTEPAELLCDLNWPMPVYRRVYVPVAAERVPGADIRPDGLVWVFDRTPTTHGLQATTW